MSAKQNVFVVCFLNLGLTTCQDYFTHPDFVCFDALLSKSTAKVMAGRSVHLITLFPGQVNQYFLHILSLVADNSTS